MRQDPTAVAANCAPRPMGNRAGWPLDERWPLRAVLLCGGPSMNQTEILTDLVATIVLSGPDRRQPAMGAHLPWRAGCKRSPHRHSLALDGHLRHGHIPAALPLDGRIRMPELRAASIGNPPRLAGHPALCHLADGGIPGDDNMRPTDNANDKVNWHIMEDRLRSKSGTPISVQTIVNLLIDLLERACRCRWKPAPQR